MPTTAGCFGEPVAAPAVPSAYDRHVSPRVFSGIQPSGELTLGTFLGAAFLRAATPKPQPRIDLDHVAPIRASVTDAITELLEELPYAGTISFRQLTGDLVERLEVVVRFLAVLALLTQGFVDLAQPATFRTRQRAVTGTVVSVRVD